MNGTQAKVCLFIAIFKFKVALLDRVTQTVQIRLRSDRDYNTTIGSVRGYVWFQVHPLRNGANPLVACQSKAKT